jgi:hypothetical protein
MHRIAKFVEKILGIRLPPDTGQDVVTRSGKQGAGMAADARRGAGHENESFHAGIPVFLSARDNIRAN